MVLETNLKPYKEFKDKIDTTKKSLKKAINEIEAYIQSRWADALFLEDDEDVKVDTVPLETKTQTTPDRKPKKRVKSGDRNEDGNSKVKKAKMPKFEKRRNQPDLQVELSGHVQRKINPREFCPSKCCPGPSGSSHQTRSTRTKT